MDLFLHLTDDVQQNVMSHLTPEDVARLCVTCRTLRQFAEANPVWKSICQKRWFHVNVDSAIDDQPSMWNSWKHQYESDNSWHRPSFDVVTIPICYPLRNASDSSSPTRSIDPHLGTNLLATTTKSPADPADPTDFTDLSDLANHPEILSAFSVTSTSDSDQVIIATEQQLQLWSIQPPCRSNSSQGPLVTPLASGPLRENEVVHSVLSMDGTHFAVGNNSGGIDFFNLQLDPQDLADLQQQQQEQQEQQERGPTHGSEPDCESEPEPGFGAGAGAGLRSGSGSGSGSVSKGGAPSAAQSGMAPAGVDGYGTFHPLGSMQLPNTSSAIVDLQYHAADQILVAITDTTFSYSEISHNALTVIDVGTQAVVQTAREILEDYELMCFTLAGVEGGQAEVISASVQGDFCNRCFGAGVPSMCFHKAQVHSAAICVFDLRASPHPAQRFLVPHRSLYPRMHLIRGTYICLSHAGTALGVWDRRFMSMPLFEESGLGHFPGQALCRGLPLPAPRRASCHQGLWMDSNDDVLLARAENGMMWAWDLSKTLGWAHDSPRQGSWQRLAAMQSGDSIKMDWPQPLGCLPCETSLPVTCVPRSSSGASTLVCHVVDDVARGRDSLVVARLRPPVLGR